MISFSCRKLVISSSLPARPFALSCRIFRLKLSLLGEGAPVGEGGGGGGGGGGEGGGGVGGGWARLAPLNDLSGGRTGSSLAPVWLGLQEGQEKLSL